MKLISHSCRALALLLLSSAVIASSEFEVKVTPPSSALKKNIEGYLSTIQASDVQELRRVRHVALAETVKAAQALGFYRTQISSHLKETDPPQLVIEVQAGPRIKLRTVDIKVEGPITELKAFRAPDLGKLKPEASLNQGLYEDAKRLIQNQASRFGFFDGKFTRHRLLIDPEAGVADIQLIYRSGPRYSLGAVTFTGNSPFDHELLQRMVPFAPDTPYDSELIAALYKSMQSSGYFETVRVDAIPTQAENLLIPVSIDLQTREQNSLSFGVGVSTDVGARLRSNWTKHWSNAQGHSYGAEVEVSRPKQNIGLWYDIPGDPPMTNKLRIAGVYQYDAPESNDTRSRLLRVGPEWQSLLPSGWQQVLSVKLLHEDYRLGEDTGVSDWLMPGVAYSFARSDNPLDPNHGYRIQFDLSGAVRGVLADNNVVHGSALVKGLTTLWERHRFLGRVQFAGTETDGFSNVPPSMRFFAGGDQSVRGYDYQSLSPRDRQGDKIGGRYMFAASAEYQYSVTEKWRAAAFIDKGNAYNSLKDPGLKTGIGVGIRWVSPVGPIRVDLAHPVDGRGVRLHFSMGPEL